jgi:Family of unknown function (DUF5662)
LRKHLKYASYLLRHKWYVFLECAKVGLWWRGLIHDLSKFLPSEWIPYANHFGGDIHRGRDGTGYYKPTDTGDPAFDFARLLHLQKRNRHHWQWWVLPEDEGGVKVLPMDNTSRLEMLCDWRGAGRAQGTPDVRAWYMLNGHRMQLHPETRAWVEWRLVI